MLAQRFGSQPALLPTDQRLPDAVVASEVINKSMRLVICFGGLKRATFLDALEERLSPPLSKVRLGGRGKGPAGRALAWHRRRREEHESGQSGQSAIQTVFACAACNSGLLVQPLWPLVQPSPPPK